MDNVTWTIRDVFIDGAYGPSSNVLREQGFELLAPTLAQQTAAVWMTSAAMSIRVCVPLGPSVPKTRLPDRPALYPGIQEVKYSMSQDGCSNGSQVPPAKRCWAYTALIVDIAGDGVRVDEESDQPVGTNVVWWMRNVTAVCEILVDTSCMQRTEPLVCFRETVRDHGNDTTAFLDDYHPGALQGGPLTAGSNNTSTNSSLALGSDGGGEAPSGAADGADRGSSESRRDVVVIASVTGAVVAVGLLSTVMVLWWRRKRRQERDYRHLSRATTPKAAEWTTSNALYSCAADDTCPSGARRVSNADVSGSLQLGPFTDPSGDGLAESSGSGALVVAICSEAADNMAAADMPVTLDTQPPPDLDLRVHLLGGGAAESCKTLSDSAAGAAESAAAAGSEALGKSAADNSATEHIRVRAPLPGSSGERRSDASSNYGSLRQLLLHPCAAPAPLTARPDSSSAGGEAASIGAASGGEGKDVSRVVELLPVVLGKGAFGRVVEGVYQGRRVAVKLIATDGPWGAPTEAFAESFAQEVQVLSRCCHPNVVRLLAACVEAPRLCLVLELMNTSVEQLMYSEPNAPLIPLAKVLHIAISVAGALAYLHPTITHRDLKPANVLLNDPHSDRPVVKLTDFGLARLRLTVVPTEHPDTGTPAYMAPECFDLERKSVSHQADMFALGVLLWEMLSGERPWAGLNPLAIALRVTCNGSRLPLKDLGESRCPDKLARLILACWETDPARRPAAAEAMKELVVMLQHVQMHSRTTSRLGRQQAHTMEGDREL